MESSGEGRERERERERSVRLGERAGERPSRGERGMRERV